MSQCINSILAQNFQDLEVIIVDDGSIDNSWQISNEYSLKDDRVHVLYKENGGVCSARNLGIKHATGKYIGFVDSDDYIEPNMYEDMIHIIEKYDVDFVMCDFKRIIESKYKKETANLEGGILF